MKTAIIGLGYVGLPLALQFARSGVSVLGLDIDGAKCKRLNAGESYIKHVPGAEVAQARAKGLLEASTDFSRVREADAILICVPTPLNKYREPDMAHVFGTGERVAPHLRKGQLVVLESTTYPGTTDTDLRSILERGSGLAAGRDFHLAFSPEREDPGNPDSSVRRIPKVVGGLTPECLARATACYTRAVERVVPVSSCRVAEARAKGLLEASTDFTRVREADTIIICVPTPLTRVPGAKGWILGLASVRGQLLPVIDLRQYLEGGVTPPSRTTRLVVVNHRDIPAGLLVDEVLGFRRFAEKEFSADVPTTIVRCGRYLAGSFRRDAEQFPVLSLRRLVEDPLFSGASA